MTHYDFIIAAYNSEKRIGRTLESLWAQLSASDVPKDHVRIVLMNNNSTDKTAEIAASYADQMPIEVIDAPVPGKSCALNLAIQKHRKGDIIFFTDDDTAFAPGWFQTFVDAMKAQPDYSVFAGRIVGIWETEIDPDLASWIPLGSTFALHEDHMESGPCQPGQVWGPNSAVRREVFDGGVTFDERIGPMPKPFYAMGQDTAMARTAYRAGFKSYFISDAVVEHTIKAATANEEWILKRAERLGYGIFATQTKEEYNRQFPAFIPLWAEILFLRLFWAAVYPLTFLMSRSKRRFWTRWKRLYYKGLWKSYRDFDGIVN